MWGWEEGREDAAPRSRRAQADGGTRPRASRCDARVVPVTSVPGASPSRPSLPTRVAEPVLGGWGLSVASRKPVCPRLVGPPENPSVGGAAVITPTLQVGKPRLSTVSCPRRPAGPPQADFGVQGLCHLQSRCYAGV